MDKNNIAEPDTKEKEESFFNILISGTPGVGKSTLCEKISKKSNLRHLNLAKIIDEKKCYEEWDDEFDCSILDESKTIQALLDIGIANGGYLVEFHDPSFLPKKWFKLVYVLTCDIKELGDRLEKRGYTEAKMKTNIQSEIFQIIHENLINEGFAVEVLENTTDNDSENNVAKILEDYEQLNKPEK